MSPRQKHNRPRLCVAKESFNGRVLGSLKPLRRESKGIALGRLAAFRLDWSLRFFLSFRCKFLCHGLLQLFSIHLVAFGCVHENIVAAGGGSLIRRVQQADFRGGACKVRPRRGCPLAWPEALVRRRSPSSLPPYAASQEPGPGYRRGGRSGSGRPPTSPPCLRSRYALEDRSQDPMASRNGQFLLFDAPPFLGPLALDLLR
jgi:hypothetical protein